MQAWSGVVRVIDGAQQAEKPFGRSQCALGQWIEFPGIGRGDRDEYRRAGQLKNEELQEIPRQAMGTLYEQEDDGEHEKLADVDPKRPGRKWHPKIDGQGGQRNGARARIVIRS